MGLDDRVRRLEEQFAGEEKHPDWSLDEQIDDTLCYLHFHQRFDSPPQRFTTRQINLLGAFYALGELPEGVGEYRFPSGALIRWTGNADGTSTMRLSGTVEVEDLPEDVARYVTRCPADQEAEREAFLYARRGWRQREQAEREQAERERERLKEKGRLSTLRHLEMLERSGSHWGDTRQRHEDFKRKLEAGEGYVPGRGWLEFG